MNKTRGLNATQYTRSERTIALDADLRWRQRQQQYELLTEEKKRVLRRLPGAFAWNVLGDMCGHFATKTLVQPEYVSAPRETRRTRLEGYRSHITRDFALPLVLAGNEKFRVDLELEARTPIGDEKKFDSAAAVLSKRLGVPRERRLTRFQVNDDYQGLCASYRIDADDLKNTVTTALKQRVFTWKQDELALSLEIDLTKTKLEERWPMCVKSSPRVYLHEFLWTIQRDGNTLLVSLRLEVRNSTGGPLPQTPCDSKDDAPMAAQREALEALMHATPVDAAFRATPRVAIQPVSRMFQTKRKIDVRMPLTPLQSLQDQSDQCTAEGWRPSMLDTATWQYRLRNSKYTKTTRVLRQLANMCKSGKQNIFPAAWEASCQTVIETELVEHTHGPGRVSLSNFDWQALSSSQALPNIPVECMECLLDVHRDMLTLVDSV